MWFSVVIPLYNKAAYIQHTLRSVLAQTCQDFEVVVVDDGSRDDGAAQALALGDSRIRVVSQANAGVSAARNRGVAEARGEWVAFLDADDHWHPQYLAVQGAAITAHPTVDVFGTHLWAVADKADWPGDAWPVVDASRPLELVTDLPRRWQQGIPFFTSSVVVRRSRLNAMQPCFPVGESLGEDLDLWFRLAEQAPVGVTPAPLVAYRVASQGSLMGSRALECLPAFLVRMRERALDASGVLPRSLRQSMLKFVADQQITMARQALVLGNRLAALRWLWHSGGYRYSRRWYLTCAMVVCVPAPWVARWDAWRMQGSASAVH